MYTARTPPPVGQPPSYAKGSSDRKLEVFLRLEYSTRKPRDTEKGDKLTEELSNNVSILARLLELKMRWSRSYPWESLLFIHMLKIFKIYDVLSFPVSESVPFDLFIYFYFFFICPKLLFLHVCTFLIVTIMSWKSQKPFQACLGDSKYYLLFNMWICALFGLYLNNTNGA